MIDICSEVTVYGKEHTNFGLHYPIYYPSFYTSDPFFVVT